MHSRHFDVALRASHSDVCVCVKHSMGHKDTGCVIESKAVFCFVFFIVSEAVYCFPSQSLHKDWFRMETAESLKV